MNEIKRKLLNLDDFQVGTILWIIISVASVFFARRNEVWTTRDAALMWWIYVDDVISVTQ